MNERMELFADELETPIGTLSIGADRDGRLRLVGFVGGHARMERELEAQAAGHGGRVRRVRDPAGFTRALRAYFGGELEAIDGLAVAFAGTDFQNSVWSALRAIPCGETLSYGELARRIGRPKAVRAVGLANGRNPIGIVVPCHRVIGADGTLTGYGGGIERKRWLLEHERRRER